MKFNNAFRNDAIAKVTGRAKYADDYKLPNMLYAVPLHSQVASAIINNIDSTEALKQKGVVAVYTAKDIPGNIKYGQIIRTVLLSLIKEFDPRGGCSCFDSGRNREIAISALP
jgi:CO/xanthine dehydrogenase Mo-binding subunit